MEQKNRAAIVALIATDFFARTSYGLCRTPLLPLWAATLGASPMGIGAIGAAATLTGLFLKFPAGTLADVFGRGPLLFAGLLVFAGAPWIYSVAAGIVALLLLRVVHGLATALYSPASMAAAAALAGDRRGEVLSWLSNTKICGSLLGAFLGGWILSPSIAYAVADEVRPDAAAFHVAWRWAGALGGVALVLGVLVVLRSSAITGGIPKKGSWAKVGRGLREAARNRALVVVSSTEGLQNVSVGMLEQFLPVYAVFVARLSTFDAGVLFGVQTVSAIVTKPLFGRLSDRRGRRSLLIVGLWACALPFALMPWTASFGLLLAAAFVFGIGEALVTSTAGALAADVAEEAGLGAAMGAFGTIGDAGHAAGPLLGGLVLSAFGAHDVATHGASPAGFRACFGIVAALMALAALALRTPRPRSAP